MVLLYIDQNFLAAILFILLSLTDAFDGYLARKLNAVSDLGKMLDPIADKLLVLSALVMLIDQGIAPAIPVIVILAREIVISGWRGSAKKVVPASVPGKVKTVVQILAVLMLMLDIPFAVPVLWLAALVSVYSGVEYVGRS